MLLLLQFNDLPCIYYRPSLNAHLYLSVCTTKKKTSTRQSILSFFSNQFFDCYEKMMIMLIFFISAWIRCISLLHFIFPRHAFYFVWLLPFVLYLLCNVDVWLWETEKHTRNYIVQHGPNPNQANAEEAMKQTARNLLKRTQCDWQFENLHSHIEVVGKFVFFLTRSKRKWIFIWAMESQQLHIFKSAAVAIAFMLIWWKSIIHFVFSFSFVRSRNFARCAVSINSFLLRSSVGWASFLPYQFVACTQFRFIKLYIFCIERW